MVIAENNRSYSSQRYRNESDEPFNVAPDPGDASRGGGSRESIFYLNAKRGRDSGRRRDHRIDDHALAVHSFPIPAVLDPRIPEVTDPSVEEGSLTTRHVR